MVSQPQNYNVIFFKSCRFDFSDFCRYKITDYNGLPLRACGLGRRKATQKERRMICRAFSGIESTRASRPPALGSAELTRSMTSVSLCDDSAIASTDWCELRIFLCLKKKFCVHSAGFLRFSPGAAKPQRGFLRLNHSIYTLEHG